MMPAVTGSSIEVSTIFNFRLNIPAKIEMIYSVTEWTWPSLAIDWVTLVEFGLPVYDRGWIWVGHWTWLLHSSVETFPMYWPWPH